MENEQKSQELNLTFLGSGNAFAPKRYWGTILVEEDILLDASPVTLPHLRMMDKDPGKINYILITHLHGDHFLGLPFLFLDSLYVTERENSPVSFSDQKYPLFYNDSLQLHWLLRAFLTWPQALPFSV